MKLKNRNDLPKPWNYKPWGMCGKCFWIEPMMDPEPIPCEECAVKYGLVDKYYEVEEAKGEE